MIINNCIDLGRSFGNDCLDIGVWKRHEFVSHLRIILIMKLKKLTKFSKKLGASTHNAEPKRSEQIECEINL